jgi:phosphoenolpyruvate carboxylase
MNLEGRYGKIGISAVQAAVRYSSDRKRAHRSIKDAGESAANNERRKPPKD